MTQMRVMFLHIPLFFFVAFDDKTNSCGCVIFIIATRIDFQFRILFLQSFVLCCSVAVSPCVFVPVMPTQ